MPERRRIFLVTGEILGSVRTGGAGTANTFLSFALAELGHDVEILITAPHGEPDLDPSWTKQYAERGIRVRILGPSSEVVQPEAFAVTHSVERALREDTPDVVIADDWGGAVYAALRARQFGLGFADTLFVVYCHGTNGWVAEAHRKLRRSPASFELEALERASVELADIVASPSAYMVEWMRGRGWEVSRSVVAPHFTQSAVERGAARPASRTGRVKRLAFFGRLEDRKGLAPFLDALNGLEANLLADLELLFVGKHAPLWPPERVEGMLSKGASGHLAGVRFEADLDQPEAIALLKRPGTLAVMPSLVDNSPCVIYECLEHGIPFLASNVGGGPELVAAEHRGRVFVEPTAEGLRAGLARLLTATDATAPVRPSFDTDHVFSIWKKIVAERPASPVEATDRAPERVSAIVLRRHGLSELHRSLESLAGQTRLPDQVVIVSTDGSRDFRDGNEWPWATATVRAPRPTPTSLREAGVGTATGELVLVLEDGDEVERECLEALLRGRALGADVATCAVRRKVGKIEETRIFIGDPRELGLVSNHYGSVALYRRSSLTQAERTPEIQGDADWVLLASLSLAGARILSVPRPLARIRRGIGSAITDPIGSDAALAVAHAFRRASPPELKGLPGLVVALSAQRAASAAPSSFSERISWVWEREGLSGLARRSGTKIARLRHKSPRLRRRFAVDPTRPPSGGEGAATELEREHSLSLGDVGQRV